MCRAMEDLRDETWKEAQRATQKAFILNLLENGKLSYEEIAHCAGLPVEEVKALDSKKSA